MPPLEWRRNLKYPQQLSLSQVVIQTIPPAFIMQMSDSRQGHVDGSYAAVFPVACTPSLSSSPSDIAEDQFGYTPPNSDHSVPLLMSNEPIANSSPSDYATDSSVSTYAPQPVFHSSPVKGVEQVHDVSSPDRCRATKRARLDLMAPPLPTSYDNLDDPEAVVPWSVPEHPTELPPMDPSSAVEPQNTTLPSLHESVHVKQGSSRPPSNGQVSGMSDQSRQPSLFVQTTRTWNGPQYTQTESSEISQSTSLEYPTSYGSWNASPAMTSGLSASYSTSNLDARQDYGQTSSRLSYSAHTSALLSPVSNASPTTRFASAEQLGSRYPPFEPRGPHPDSVRSDPADHEEWAHMSPSHVLAGQASSSTTPSIHSASPPGSSAVKDKHQADSASKSKSKSPAGKKSPVSSTRSNKRKTADVKSDSSAASEGPLSTAAEIAERPKRSKLPRPVTDYLKAWLFDNVKHPYPAEEKKKEMCAHTGLTMTQLSNWFINARRRILQPHKLEQEKRELEGQARVSTVASPSVMQGAPHPHPFTHGGPTPLLYPPSTYTDGFAHPHYPQQGPVGRMVVQTGPYPNQPHHMYRETVTSPNAALQRPGVYPHAHYEQQHAYHMQGYAHPQGPGGYAHPQGPGGYAHAHSPSEYGQVHPSAEYGPGHSAPHTGYGPDTNLPGTGHHNFGNPNVAGSLPNPVSVSVPAASAGAVAHSSPGDSPPNTASSEQYMFGPQQQHQSPSHFVGVQHHSIAVPALPQGPYQHHGQHYDPAEDDEYTEPEPGPGSR